MGQWWFQMIVVRVSRVCAAECGLLDGVGVLSVVAGMLDEPGPPAAAAAGAGAAEKSAQEAPLNHSYSRYEVAVDRKDCPWRSNRRVGAGACGGEAS